MVTFISILHRMLLSFGVPAMLALISLFLLLRFPHPGWSVLSLLASFWSVVVVLAWARRIPWSRLGIHFLLILCLGATALIGLQYIRTADQETEYWEHRGQQHLDRAEMKLRAEILGLQQRTMELARHALMAGPDLERLAQPVQVGSNALNVGISIWQEGRLLNWAGEVPGPERPRPSPFPLIVDHGFRRYLTVSAEDSLGRRAFVDLSLGITRDLFPRLGMGADPGQPFSRMVDLHVELLSADPGSRSARSNLDRILSIPEEDPWIWLGLSAPRLREERQAAILQEGRWMAWGLLLSLMFSALLGWRNWPKPPLDLHSVARIGVAVSLLIFFRIAMDQTNLLSLAFQGIHGQLALLLEPAYFATTKGFGLLRTVSDFIFTGWAIAAIAMLMLPVWLHLMQPSSRAWKRWTGFLLLMAGSWATMHLCANLQQIVAQNSNPELIGLDAPFFTFPFLMLHGAMLLVLMAPSAWMFLGWERWLRGSGRKGLMLAGLSGLLLLLILHGQGMRLSVAFFAMLIPLVGILLEPVLADASFARRVVAGLVAVIWLAALQSHGLEAVYSGLKEGVAHQKALERLAPEDNWRRFLLEEFVRELSTDIENLSRLTDPTSDRSNATFELWAGSSLSAVGYGSRIELMGNDGRVISEFDLGLPYESRPLRSWRLASSSSDRVYWVEAIELATEGGPYLVYRGVLDLNLLVPQGDARWLIVDLPYASQDAATPVDMPPVGPAALGFAAARELSPRQEFDAPILIARLGVEEVEAASDPALLELQRLHFPVVDQWQDLRLASGRYRAILMVGSHGQDLIVAFAKPSMIDQLLDSSRLIALYVIFGGILALLMLVARLLRSSPELLWPRQLGVFGFQERLLGSILMVVLLPVIVSGIFHDRRASDRVNEDNLQEVANRLDTALHLLASNLDDLAGALISGEYVQDILDAGNTVARRELGPLELGQLMVFSPSGGLLLDETLRDFSAEEALHYRDGIMGGRLILESDDWSWYIGRLYPVLSGDGSNFHVYVRKMVDDETLGRLARTVGADLTLYDGPWAVVSSQDYLYKAGLLTPILPSVAHRVILEGGSHRYVQADPGEGLVVAKGFAGLAGSDTERQGVLSARLFTRATQAAREQRRAQLFLFGLSSLAFVLAVAVGLLVAARIVDPIQTLVAATRRVASGDFQVRVVDKGRDEIGQLMNAFNQMTEELFTSQLSLASRRSFLEAILGNLSAGVLVLDRNLDLIEANSASSRLLSGQDEKLISRIESMGPPQTLVESELQLADAEGPRTLRLVITPIQLEDGSAGWLVLFDDLTELLASRRLALYAEMARQVAHEVKNPLTPIQLAAQMVRQACHDRHSRMEEIVNDNVSQIEDQVERLRNIASEFSLLGRTELPDLESASVNALVHEIAGLYPSPDGRLKIRVEAEEDFPVLVSRNAILKVMTNLVENAIQAMGGEGEILLKARREGDVGLVSVEDQGPGIPEELQAKLFEPYFSTKSTGTGLGLVICRSLMEKMGGGISLGNRSEGRGAIALLQLSLLSPDKGNES